jgi:hypothetical protein
VHRRDARGLEARLEAEVEVGRVDADEEVGRSSRSRAREAAADAEQLAQALSTST